MSLNLSDALFCSVSDTVDIKGCTVRKLRLHFFKERNLKRVTANVFQCVLFFKNVIPGS